MPYLVKCLLEFYEDMIEILLMLQVCRPEDPEIVVNLVVFHLGCAMSIFWMAYSGLG